MKHGNSRLISSVVGLWVLACSFHVGATPITGFNYWSSATSWVGRGESVVLGPEDGFDFFVSRNFDFGISFRINDFANNPDPFATRWWNLDFAAPMNIPIAVESYVGATRYPFQDINEPGLAFSGNGAGNNQLSGFFDVFEVLYSSTGEVLTFAADFTQYDEKARDRWNRGSLRFNSQFPLTPISAPATVILLLVGVALSNVSLTRRSYRSPFKPAGTSTG